ncbi:NAD-P-binding protein [Mycena alexandri]|uniref:NAD-P-binding protein n=1 Tax=Mycena alexandri TaxID=1745969 RepID=A0AAD6X6J0_9AGAR|nr:NAD-P-binding protein [Mycena alexandri]
MPSISAVRIANSKYTSTNIPVAIFVGGTSGIGRATAEAFARYTKGNAHIILVGRNAIAAEAVLASFPNPQTSDSRWKHEFVQCDASLLQNVHATLTALAPRIPRVNYLVLSAGYFSLAGGENTAEGLDRKLVLNYYSRWAFISGLLPALRRAHNSGEDASVMTVLAAGQGSKVNLEDLGLGGKATGPTSIAATYTDLMIEEFATRNTGIVFTHTYPGFVNTPLFSFEHWGARLLAPLTRLALFFLAKTPADAAEYQLYGLLQSKAGAHRRGEYGDEICSQPVWTHTENVVSARV